MSHRIETVESRRLQAGNLTTEALAGVVIDIAANNDCRTPTYREAVLREAARRLLYFYKDTQ